MTHFAVIAPPFLSHVRALEALACELIERGHRVTWFHQVDVHALIDDRRIGFAPVGGRSHPAGSLAGVVVRAAHPGSPLGLRRVIADMSAATEMLCNEAPALFDAWRIDAVIADQMEAAGGLLAASRSLPWVSVACALPIDREPELPLPVMPWGYADSPAALQRNAGSTRVYDWFMGSHGRAIAGCATALGLAGRKDLLDCVSPTLQLSQTIEGFDFPRRSPPAGFHHVGPLRHAVRVESVLEWPVSSSRPFVFASLGTLQGGRMGLFRRIARACRQIDAQLLVAHCGGLDASRETILRREGATWVTDFAPQRAVLARADVLVTHAGLNTVMDALAAGTPMLALPIGFDQPGVAARIVHAGIGLRRSAGFASARSIGDALRELIDEAAYARRAAALGADIASAGGSDRAADLIETHLVAEQPLELSRAA